VIRALRRPVLLVAGLVAVLLLLIATGHSGSKTTTFVLLAVCGVVLVPLLAVTRSREKKSRRYR
jgi:O-antigen ligase